MKRFNLILAVSIILIFVTGLNTPTLAWPDPIIQVVPMEHDFRYVVIGTSSTTIITISNVGGHDLQIIDIGLMGGSSADFSITMAPSLPVLIPPPNGHPKSIDVEITYSPSAVGDSSAVLEIYSNDPVEAVVRVSLEGFGVEASILNGGFETGDFTDWYVWASSAYPPEFLITTDAHSGLYAAKASMDESCENGSFEQAFVVPPEGIFAFYYKSNMQGGFWYDGYRILSGWGLFDITTGTQITSTYFIYTTDYTPASYDLSAYAGHLVRFMVHVGSDGTCSIPIDSPHEVLVDDVRIVSVEEQIAVLIDRVENLIDPDVLNKGQGNSLIKKLEGALQKLNNGNTKAACNQLQAFINQVDAFIRSGILTVEEGQPLIDATIDVINDLCG